MEQNGLPGFKELLMETLFTITSSSDTSCNAFSQIDAGEPRPKRAPGELRDQSPPKPRLY